MGRPHAALWRQRQAYNPPMEPELKQKIEKYVANKYSVKQQRIRAEYLDMQRCLSIASLGLDIYLEMDIAKRKQL